MYRLNRPESRLQPWLFQVKPYEEESFGHYLGRFRRANHLSCSHLSALLGQQSRIVAYWESPSRRRRPSSAELQQLSELSGIEISRFCLMWPSSGRVLHWPTRCCAGCYAAAPWHKLTWQLSDRPDCAVHQRQLLSECPCCGSAFQLPSHWATGQCDCCLLSFADMRDYELTRGSD